MWHERARGKRLKHRQIDGTTFTITDPRASAGRTIGFPTAASSSPVNDSCDEMVEHVDLSAIEDDWNEIVVDGRGNIWSTAAATSSPREIRPASSPW
jgi:hypothetical protein